MSYIRSIGYFLITLLIYLGIPLLGWGLGDIKGFFNLLPRVVYGMMVVLVGGGIAWQSLNTPEGFRGGKGRKEDLILRQQVIKVG